jgi:hypothetical protein
VQYSYERSNAEQNYVDGFHASILNACGYRLQAENHGRNRTGKTVVFPGCAKAHDSSAPLPVEGPTGALGSGRVFASGAKSPVNGGFARE